MSFRLRRNERGEVDAANRIRDGATVPRWDANDPITKEYNAWLTQNPGADANYPIDADLLARLRADKKQELKAACTEALDAGFTSSALGTPHTYKGRLLDQTNMNSAATLSTLKKLSCQLTCTNASGVRALRAHSQDQAQSVLRDFKTFQEPIQGKYRTLSAQVVAATTPAQIKAIVWA